MEDRKNIIGSIILMATFLSPCFVHAYEADTTHHGLTDEIVDFYNYSFPDSTLSDTQKELVKRGAVEEDSPETRVVNHFYDPVRNIGLKGAFPTSKAWATNTDLQSGRLHFGTAALVLPRYFSPTDYSWERAIYEYAHGSKERGLLALGHVLHLLEDKAVPDHTRNDAHLSYMEDERSPYEMYAGRFSDSNIEVTESLVTRGIKPIPMSSIESALDQLAKISNENFFSKSTIKNSIYSKPELKSRTERSEKLTNGKNVTFVIETYGAVEYKLYRIERKAGLYSREEYSIVDHDYLVMNDYWNILSEQAVLHGAGVVKLFFEEVEKEKLTKRLYELNKPVVQRVTESAARSLVRFFTPREGSNGAAVISALKQRFGESAPAAIIASLPAVPNEPASPEEPVVVEQPFIEPIPEISEQEVLAEIRFVEPEPLALEIQQVLQPQAPIFPVFAVGNPADDVQRAGGNQLVDTTSEDDEEIVEEVTDEMAPSVIFDVPSCADSIAVSNCVSFGGTTTFAWNSLDIDVDYFEFSIDEAFATTVVTSTEVYLEPESEGEARVVVVDRAGNRSSEIISPYFAAASPVIINEIAWMGTTASTTGEWVELRNRSSETIDLSGWTLVAQDGTPSINLTGSIAPRGYFLLERRNDTAVADISADLVYGNGAATWSLSNDGEELQLLYRGALVDQTPLVLTGWTAGNNAGKHSMERYLETDSGNDEASWGNNLEIIKNGSDAGGGAIFGTPRARNSLDYLIHKGEPIAEAVRITVSRSPYVVTGQKLAVLPSGSLEIDSDVEVHFNSIGADIYGQLTLRGDESSVVTFAGLDGGSWGTLLIGTTQENPLSGFTLKKSAGISVEDAEVDFEDMLLEDNQSGALELYAATATCTRCTFTNNQGQQAVIYGGSHMSLTDSVFENSPSYGEAIDLSEESTLIVSNSTFRSLIGSGIVVYGASTLSVENSLFSGLTIGSALNLFDNARALISSSRFEDFSEGAAAVEIYDSSHATVTTATFARGTTEAIAGFEDEDGAGSSLDIFESTFSDFNTGLVAFGPVRVGIATSTFANNLFGLEFYDGTQAVIASTTLAGNTSAGLVTENTEIDARNNWWGSESGPYHETNNTAGLGDIIFGSALFNPWIGKVVPEPEPEPEEESEEETPEEENEEEEEDPPPFVGEI